MKPEVIPDIEVVPEIIVNVVQENPVEADDLKEIFVPVPEFVAPEVVPAVEIFPEINVTEIQGTPPEGSIKGILDCYPKADTDDYSSEASFVKKGQSKDFIDLLKVRIELSFSK